MWCGVVLDKIFIILLRNANLIIPKSLRSTVSLYEACGMQEEQRTQFPVFRKLHTVYTKFRILLKPDS